MIYLKLAWRNLWRNKLRTLLSVGAISLVAYFPSTTLTSFQVGTHEFMLNTMLSNIGHLQVLHKDYWRERDINMAFELENQDSIMAAHPAIKVILPRIEGFALASTDNSTKPALVLGIHPDKEKLFSNLDEKMDTGTYFTQNGVLINKELAEKMELSIGDSIALLGQGYHASSAVGLYKVEGIIKLLIPGTGAVLLPFDKASEFYSTENKASTYLVGLNHPDKHLHEVDSLLSQHIHTENIDVRTWRTLIPELVAQIEFEQATNIFIAGILYLIVAFGLFGTILMMTEERRKEFGIMMAIGMNKIKMCILVVIETILISIIGLVVGFLISAPIIFYFHANPLRLGTEYEELTEKFGFEPVISFNADVETFTSQIFIIFILSMIISIYPISKIIFSNISKSIRD